MPLKIIAASDPIRVETIVLTIYGPPGVGKSTLGFMADAPLLIDADRGAYRAAIRKDTATAEEWADISGITKADVAPFNTLVMDTAGRTLDLLTADIIAQNPKMGRGGALTLQGYGELKSRFIAYLKLVRSFGLDVVLITHSDEKNQGDDLIERIDMQGASKNEVYKVSDAMARIGIVGGKRLLTFSPTETKFGKDPAGIGSVEVPHAMTNPHFLAEVIKGIKDALNSLSADQVQALARAEEWAAALAACQVPEDFTKLVPEALDATEKRALIAAAYGEGFVFDKKGGKFVIPAGALAS